MNDTCHEVAVVGAGVVGLCVAHELSRAGKRVVLIDPEPPGSQCSSGNSGALSAGSVAPLAMPRVVRSSLPLLADPNGPLFVPPAYWLQAAPWLWRFVRASQPQRVQQIALALHGLLHDAVGLHVQLARRIRAEHLIRHNGQLHLYPNEAAMSADRGGWALKAQHGLKMEQVDAAAIHTLEPAVRHDRYTAGYFLPDEGSVVSPLAYSQAIAAALAARGVAFERAHVDALKAGSGEWALRCAGRELHAKHVVVCAGAWSSRLLRTVGLTVPLQSQRGYHLQYPGLRDTLNRVVVLADRKVFINPMQDGLRIGGTVEIDSLERPMREQRARRLADHLQAGLHLPAKTGPAKSWMGHRPCLPDSMPVLGAVPHLTGLWCAFGHGHLGLTGAAKTARWLMQSMVEGRAPKEMAPFSISRFMRG